MKDILANRARALDEITTATDKATLELNRINAQLAAKNAPAKFGVEAGRLGEEQYNLGVLEQTRPWRSVASQAAAETAATKSLIDQRLTSAAGQRLNKTIDWQDKQLDLDVLKTKNEFEHYASDRDVERALKQAQVDKTKAEAKFSEANAGLSRVAKYEQVAKGLESSATQLYRQVEAIDKELTPYLAQTRDDQGNLQRRWFGALPPKLQYAMEERLKLRDALASKAAGLFREANGYRSMTAAPEAPDSSSIPSGVPKYSGTLKPGQGMLKAPADVASGGRSGWSVIDTATGKAVDIPSLAGETPQSKASDKPQAAPSFSDPVVQTHAKQHQESIKESTARANEELAAKLDRAIDAVVSRQRDVARGKISNTVMSGEVPVTLPMTREEILAELELLEAQKKELEAKRAKLLGK
jgi:hypothetical protein